MQRLVLVIVLTFGCGRIGFDPTGAGDGTGTGTTGRDCLRSGATYHSGDTFAAGDGCNSCTCSDGSVSCTSQACPDACATCGDAGVSSACAPSGGCPSGPACGPTGVCCSAGEQCVGGECVCGNGGTACTPPDSCQGPGPITDGFRCGTLCCSGIRCPV